MSTWSSFALSLLVPLPVLSHLLVMPCHPLPHAFLSLELTFASVFVPLTVPFLTLAVSLSVSLAVLGMSLSTTAVASVSPVFVWRGPKAGVVPVMTVGMSMTVCERRRRSRRRRGAGWRGWSVVRSRRRGWTMVRSRALGYFLVMVTALIWRLQVGCA